MADSKIQANSLNLDKIIVDKERFYQIPNYQRPYSWDKDNIAELIGDLSSSFLEQKEEEYFCGSLVLVKNDKDKRFDVIDGQQRLTTFTILACVIRDLYFELLEDRTKDYIKDSISDKYNNENEKLNFLTDTHFQADFKNTFILNKLQFEDNKNIEKDFKHNKYLQNAYYIKNELSDLLKKNQINDFVKWLYEKVILTEIVCPNEESAIRIFNVLNNRGMPLNPTDILKSSLMQQLNEEDRESFKAVWQEIIEKLQFFNYSFDEVLNSYLYFLTAKNPKKRLDEELLRTDKFKKDNPIQIITEIKYFSNLYIELLQNKEDNKHIHCLKYLPNKIYWISILLTAKYFKYKEYNKLIEVIMAYYYQNFIAGLTANQFKQTSFNILGLLREKNGLETIIKEIKDNLEKYKTTERYQDLLDNEIYFFGYKWIKPILLLVEYFSVDKLSFVEINNKLHLEHILPQTLPNKEKYPDAYSYWKNRFDEEELKDWTDNLANLILLGFRKNIQAQNYDFPAKKQIYKNKDKVATAFHTTKEVLQEKEWNIKALRNRKKRLIEKINQVIDIFKNVSATR